MINQIILLCPANVKTGGPELIHQFSYYVNNNSKIDCFIDYFDIQQGKSPVNQDFLKYNPKRLSDFIDTPETLVIVPETRILSLSNYKYAKKAIWWQSVDNFGINYVPFFRLKTYIDKVRAIESCIYRLDFLKKPLLYSKVVSLVKKADFHLCQSYYSKDYITHKMGIKNNIYMLSDYISNEYTSSIVDYTKKKNWIAYNPRKGFEITKKLIASAPAFEWKPIENMTTLQVMTFLQQCKVYIDFGNFPGKDRMPREAAMSGCCIITGKRGAAKYQQDVNIPTKYKFDSPLISKKQVIECIEDCFDYFDDRINEFAGYREEIKNEQKKFYQEIDYFLDVVNANN
jgi:hypothetical protein